MRYQVVDPNPRQQEIAVVIDHMPEVRNRRVRKPANGVITRLLVPAWRCRADAAEAAMNRRPDPVVNGTLSASPTGSSIAGILEPIERQVGTIRVRHPPAHDAARVDVDDERDVDKPGPSRRVRQIREPQSVRTRGPEHPVDPARHGRASPPQSARVKRTSALAEVTLTY